MIVAFISWIDAHGGSGQRDLKTARESHLDRMASAGILVNETAEFVTIVQDYFGDGKDYDELQVRTYETIPRAGIVKMQKFKVSIKEKLRKEKPVNVK